jgi:hypothetical protein
LTETRHDIIRRAAETWPQAGAMLRQRRRPKYEKMATKPLFYAIRGGALGEINNFFVGSCRAGRRDGEGTGGMLGSASMCER